MTLQAVQHVELAAAIAESVFIILFGISLLIPTRKQR